MYILVHIRFLCTLTVYVEFDQLPRKRIPRGYHHLASWVTFPNVRAAEEHQIALNQSPGLPVSPGQTVSHYWRIWSTQQLKRPRLHFPQPCVLTLAEGSLGLPQGLLPVGQDRKTFLGRHPAAILLRCPNHIK